jgi:ketosteroid isomerase-like protein
MLPGCEANKDAAANDTAATVDVAAVEQELRSIETAWNADYAARNVDKLVGYYGEDAALAESGVALAGDTASRRKSIETFIADPSLKVEFASDRVGVAQSGELAYTRGHYTTTATDPATKQAKVQTGNYLTVWRKQADGSWKAVEDFIVPGAPPAAAPAAQ